MSFDVGYAKPPIATRFQPGKSGNPKGRPKGSKNYERVLEEFLDEADPGRLKGERRFSRAERSVRRPIDRAVAGDLRAVVLVVKMMIDLDRLPEPRSLEPSPPINLEAVRRKGRGIELAQITQVHASEFVAGANSCNTESAKTCGLEVQQPVARERSEEQPISRRGSLRAIEGAVRAPHEADGRRPASTAQLEKIAHRAETPAQAEERRRKKREREGARRKGEIAQRRTSPLERGAAIARERVVASIRERAET